MLYESRREGRDSVGYTRLKFRNGGFEGLHFFSKAELILSNKARIDKIVDDVGKLKLQFAQIECADLYTYKFKSLANRRELRNFEPERGAGMGSRPPWRGSGQNFLRTNSITFSSPCTPSRSAPI